MSDKKSSSSENSPEKEKGGLMALILKIIGGLLIALILLMGVGWMTQGIWMTTISDHPSGEEMEKIRNKEQYQY